MTSTTVSQQLQALSVSARRLRELVGHPLPAGDERRYVRPMSNGCAVLSVDPFRRPQQGIIRRWMGADFQTWTTDLDTALDERDRQPARETPGNALRSLLIGDAIRNQGWMGILSAACPERPRLRFLGDEMTLNLETGAVEIDLLAVRWEDGAAVPVVIEVKVDRRLKRLTEALHAAATLVEEHGSAFAALAEACWDVPVRLESRVERWLVWPVADDDSHGDLDPRSAKCRAEGVRLVTVGGGPGKDLRLQAAARI